MASVSPMVVTAGRGGWCQVLSGGPQHGTQRPLYFVPLQNTCLHGPTPNLPVPDLLVFSVRSSVQPARPLSTAHDSVYVLTSHHVSFHMWVTRCLPVALLLGAICCSHTCVPRRVVQMCCVTGTWPTCLLVSSGPAHSLSQMHLHFTTDCCRACLNDALGGLTEPSSRGQLWTSGCLVAHGQVLHRCQGPVKWEDLFSKRLILCGRWHNLAEKPRGLLHWGSPLLFQKLHVALFHHQHF